MTSRGSEISRARLAIQQYTAAIPPHEMGQVPADEATGYASAEATIAIARSMQTAAGALTRIYGVLADAFPPATPVVYACPGCGCTDAEGCYGGCHWISFGPDLLVCTACVLTAARKIREDR